MGDLELALYGSFLPIPSVELFQVRFLNRKKFIYFDFDLESK